MKTTIMISHETRNMIKTFGRYGETIEDIILRAFASLKEKEGKQ